MQPGHRVGRRCTWRRKSLPENRPRRALTSTRLVLFCINCWWAIFEATDQPIGKKKSAIHFCARIYGIASRAIRRSALLKRPVSRPLALVAPASCRASPATTARPWRDLFFLDRSWPVAHAFPSLPFASAVWISEQRYEDFLQRAGRKTPTREDFVFLGVDQATLEMPPLTPEELANNRAFSS